MELTGKNVRHLFNTRLWPSISAFWSWWSTELLDMLPEKARNALQPAGTSLFLELDGTDVVTSHGSIHVGKPVAGYPLAAGDKTPVIAVDDNVREIVLCLPQDKVLIKPLKLPLATEENLCEVLAFEMDRQTPFKADQVYYDFAVTARDPGEQSLELSLVLTPRQELDGILTALAERGIHPDLVTVNCDRTDKLRNINLLPEKYRGHRTGTSRRINIMIGILALALLTGAVSLPLLGQRHKIKMLEPLLETAETKAEVAGRLRDTVEELKAESSFLVNRKQSTLLVLQVMDEVTRILPDDSWVFQVQIRGSEVQIQGQSASAAALIPLIESSDILYDARFRSPVTQAPRSILERFHLSASTRVPTP